MKLEFNKWIFEQIDYGKEEFIINKGSILYHGTIESYDTRILKVGNYDKIFWLTEDYIIAKSYIPKNGSYILFMRPEDIEKDKNIMKSLNISNNIERLSYNYHKKILDKIIFLEKKIDLFRKDLKKIEDSDDEYEVSLFFKNWRECESELILLKKQYKTYNYLTIKYIIKKMEQYGYKFDKSYRGFHKIKKDRFGNLLPNDYTSQGKVLEIEILKDLKIYNLGLGKESDLTDLEYHNIKRFKEIEENNMYDGVAINDFVNTDYNGPYPHKSIGLFEKSLNFVKVKKIKKERHPQDNEW